MNVAHPAPASRSIPGDPETAPTVRDFVRVAKALADEGRVRALLALAGGELCLCQLVDLLGLAPSTVSRHVKELCAAGLVTRRKQGKWHYFRLAGGDARQPAAGGLAWLAASVGGGREAAEILAAQCCVRDKDLAELTACYA